MKKRTLFLLLVTIVLVVALSAAAWADPEDPPAVSPVFPEGRYEIPFHWYDENADNDTHTAVPANNPYDQAIKVAYPDADDVGTCYVKLTSDAVQAQSETLSVYPYWFDGLTARVEYDREEAIDPHKVSAYPKLNVNPDSWARVRPNGAYSVLDFLPGEELTGTLSWQALSAYNGAGLTSGEIQIFCQLPGYATAGDGQKFQVEPDRRTYYAKGQAVTVTVTPGVGYVWAENPNFTLRDRDGNEHDVTPVPTENEGEYQLSFTMPAGNAFLYADTVHVGDYQISMDGGAMEPFVRNEETGLWEYTHQLLPEHFEGLNAFVRSYGADIFIDGEQYYVDRHQVPCVGVDCFAFDSATDLPLKTLGEEDDGSDRVFLNLLASHPGTYTFILDPEQATLSVTCGHAKGEGDHYSFLAYSREEQDMASAYVLGDVMGAIQFAEPNDFWSPPTREEVPTTDFSGETILWSTFRLNGIDQMDFILGKDGVTYSGTLTENTVKTLTPGSFVKVSKNNVPDDVEAVYDFYYGADSHKLEVKRRAVKLEVTASVDGKVSDEISEQLTVTPAGPYYSGDTLTFTAPYVPGLKCTGWWSFTDYYVNDETQEEEEVWDQWSDTFDWTVCVTSDDRIQARYEAQGDLVIENVFPDPAFQAYVSTNIDTDHNGLLSGEEIGAVKVINFGDASDDVESLAGIEYFPLLEELYCDPFTFSMSGKLAEVDLSQNHKLKVVDLACNPLTGLDYKDDAFSVLPDLEELNVSFSNLHAISLDNNAKLKRLTVNDTNIFYLNVNWNPQLEWLDCCGLALNDGLDISSCPKLLADYLAGNRTAELVATKPYLAGKQVYGQGNEDQAYNLAADEGVKIFFYYGEIIFDNAFNAYVYTCIDKDHDGILTTEDRLGVKVIDLEDYAIDVRSLEDIDLFPNLEELRCDPFTFGVDGQLESVDLSKNTKLKTVDLGCNPLTAVDVSMLPDLESLMLGFTNLQSIDLSHNPNLRALWVDDSPLAALNISNNPKLAQLDACGTGITRLDISGCPALVADYQAGDRTPELLATKPYLAGKKVFGGEGDGYNLAIDEGLVIIDGTEPVNEPCGENLTWSFDTETGVLTITGTGAMGETPWYEFADQITKVALPSGLTTISDWAFNGCTGLTSLDIPATVTYIGEEAFAGCTSLATITMPDSVRNIGGGVFADTAWWNAQSNGLVYLNKALLGYKGTAPETVSITAGTNAIAANAFRGCSGIKSISIPNTVTHIGHEAFLQCESLTSLTLPSGLVALGYGAFGECAGLTSMVIPEGVTSIEFYTFVGCSGMESITLPAGLKEVGMEAFTGCDKLKDVYYHGTPLQKAGIEIDAVYDGNAELLNATWHYAAPASIEMKTLPATLTYTEGEAPEVPVVTDGVVLAKYSDDETAEIALTADMISGYDPTKAGVQTLTVTFEGKTATFEITIEHVPGEAVKENEVAATCAAEGGYDMIVYCTICHEEVSREHMVLEKTTDHVPGEPVRENEVPATCVADGSYDEVVHCTVCGEVLSTEHVEVEKTGVHTPGAPVRENEVKATTTTRGHYDEVVYCTVCGEELSREEKVINKSVKGLTITGEPESATVKNGEKAKFTVKISGKATAIQWYYRTSETAKWKKVSSKGNKLTLTVTGKPGNDGYQYRCELKNGKKKLYSDTVTLDVELFPPTISSQPESVAIKAGEEATFTFGVEGEGVTYAWSYRKSATGKWAAVKGGTRATLTVTGTAANAGYQYKCEAKNKDGSVTSDIVTLDVEYHLPEIVTQPKGVKVKKNAKVTFTVEANDPYEEELTFQWYYRKSSKAKWTKIKGATEAAYSFKATAKKSGYQYKCDITNRDGTVSTKAVTLKVK